MEKKAYIFPGQGSQVVGMGEDLYNQYEIAKRTFDSAKEILGFDLKKICFKGRATEILRNDNLSLTVYVTCVALFRILEASTDLEGSYMAGHSLGEITALTCSGSLSFEDGLKLLQKRGKYAMDTMKITNGQMAIVEFSNESDIQDVCNSMKNVYLSCINSKSQFSISGEAAEVLQALKQLQEKGARVTPLFWGPPFHCPLMKEAAGRFADDVKEIHFEKQRIPVVSNVTGKIYEQSKGMDMYLSEQLTKPVQWVKTLDTFEKLGVEHVVEVAYKSVLKDFCSSRLFEISVYSP